MRRAVSIVELVIVVAIIGLIAALAIPRLSGAEEEDRDAATRPALVVLRTAIELYAHDHGHYPGQCDADLDAAALTPDALVAQLTERTNADGTCGGAYGPYLAATPRFDPGDPNSDRITLFRRHEPLPARDGWAYCPDNGYICAVRDGVEIRPKRRD